eukprot:754312-Hanusia_phi.AAC.1
MSSDREAGAGAGAGEGAAAAGAGAGAGAGAEARWGMGGERRRRRLTEVTWQKEREASRLRNMEIRKLEELRSDDEVPGRRARENEDDASARRASCAPLRREKPSSMRRSGERGKESRC